MPVSAAVHVKGLREAQRAFRKLGGELDQEMREGLQHAGEAAAEDAQRRFNRYSPVSAAGLVSKVKLKAVVVQQKKRRKNQGDPYRWGDLQMRKALVPAREATVDTSTREMEKLLDRMCGRAGF